MDRFLPWLRAYAIALTSGLLVAALLFLAVSPAPTPAASLVYAGILTLAAGGLALTLGLAARHDWRALFPIGAGASAAARPAPREGIRLALAALPAGATLVIIGLAFAFGVA